MPKRFDQRFLLPDWAAIVVALAFIAFCIYIKGRPGTEGAPITSHPTEKK